MDSITFTPSEKLHQALKEKADEVGLSQADLVSYILEHIDLDLFFYQSSPSQPAKSLDKIADSILAAIYKNRRENIGKTFILNDIPEFRRTPLSIRPALGKLLYQKMLQDPSASAAPVIDRVEADGMIIYKKRQRSMLYQYKTDTAAADQTHMKEDWQNPILKQRPDTKKPHF